MSVYHVDVNGLQVEAVYEETAIQTILLPLLQNIRELSIQKQRRIIVFLAAPPATGKSTLTLFLEQLYQKQYHDGKLQVLGMDGFHYHQEYILSHSIIKDGTALPMKEVKGCPETFRVDDFKQKLLELRKGDVLWPYYNRRLHDVEEDKIRVTKDIILLEGNYLLLQEEKWKGLSELCDYSIFLDAPQDLLKLRLVKRKMAGGALPHQASAFYEQSERVNIERIRNHSKKADLLLMLDQKGNLYQP